MNTKVVGSLLAFSAVVLFFAVRAGSADLPNVAVAFLDGETAAVSDSELDRQQARGLADQGVEAPGAPGDWGVILWDELKSPKPGTPRPAQPGQGSSTISTSTR
ncbi:hypothetical protein [Pelagibius sp.]|uniref:hypothetical protein n=1 Tax=Pelagibius sp. TaxID=1931238 RepID=UPI003B50E163